MKSNPHFKFFRNFADETKLRIIESLRKSDLSVNEISETTGVEQSAVSHQLKQLAECNIVFSNNEGKRRIYKLNSRSVEPLLKMAELHVNHSCSCDCPAYGKCLGASKNE